MLQLLIHNMIYHIEALFYLFRVPESWSSLYPIIQGFYNLFLAKIKMLQWKKE